MDWLWLVWAVLFTLYTWAVWSVGTDKGEIDALRFIDEQLRERQVKAYMGEAQGCTCTLDEGKNVVNSSCEQHNGGQSHGLVHGE